VAQNVSAYNASYTYNLNGSLNTITYTLPNATTIVKTYSYVGTNINTIVLSGSGLPTLATTTKTYAYDSNGIYLVSTVYS